MNFFAQLLHFFQLGGAFMYPIAVVLILWLPRSARTRVFAAMVVTAIAAGELLWCTRCNDLVATTSKQKFVGMARGGMKTQVRCARCSKILDGPWF